MNPLDPNDVGILASEASTSHGRQASARITAMRTSEDPQARAAASGTIAGLGQPADLAKTGRILKPAKL